MCSSTSEERPVPGHHPALDQGMAGCNVSVPSAPKTLHAVKGTQMTHYELKVLPSKGSFGMAVPREEDELKPQTGPLFKELQGRSSFCMQGINVLLNPLWISTVSSAICTTHTAPEIPISKPSILWC